ncbi:MAG: efflux RND transporter periplasmic adaptor subunit [Pirellulaceae bacterium]|nr:efflux RND transporter periplasmic adaptor subunit [Pirellulaceae bacterium]
MTPQFESNTVASALTAFASNEVPLGPSSQQPAKPQVAPSPTSGRLVDWNVTHPDGSDQTIHDLLASISKPLGAEVYFGRALANGDAGTIFSSHSQAHDPSEVSIGLKSSVVEACFASGRFMFASEKDATSGVLENYRRSEKFQVAVGLSIPDQRGPAEMSSGLVIGFRQALPSNLDLSNYLPQLRLELTSWTHAWHACRDRRTPNVWSRLARSIQRYRTKIVVLSICAGCIMTFVPIPYWPQRECVVEPSARRFVSSPIDGRVLKSLVRPGDVVEAGQIIGQMDDEQLRWELGAAQAELQQASKQQDSALAHQEGGKMRLAQLEQQKIALKIQGLQAQLERLELRSPVAGVVLQGEWYRSEGAPVARGDTLFEIAPLEKMTVQVHLTTEDLGEIEIDDSATVRIDSAYGEAWKGTLSRIDPRAAVIDDEVRFVADMEVENRENRLRPGMKGSVRIDAGYKTIGWAIFHRPYRWLMKNLVW